MSSYLKRAVRAAWPGIRGDTEAVVRRLASSRRGRAALRAICSRLGTDAFGILHDRFAGVFRESPGCAFDGTWSARFAAREVRLPLRGDRMWLDWDAAMSLIGHETEIKKTYARLLTGHGRPRLFVDVGANYGLHSLLFLVHGVRTISIEPNLHCHAYFHEICALNGVVPDLLPVALGEDQGEIELHFPERETWLGTTEAGVQQELGTSGKLARVRVARTTLDDVCAEAGVAPMLVKIDVEGAELGVLLGGSRTLAHHRPTLILECWRDGPRRELHAMLANFDYLLADLPLADEPRELGESEFLEAPGSNFAALPRGPQPAAPT